MAKKEIVKKDSNQESFWSKYKLYIVGCLGAILLISILGLQNITVCFVTESGEKYAAKMDYNFFGICTSCIATTDNAQDIVEKAIFFMRGKDATVEEAIKGLQEIAGSDQGTVGILAGGVMVDDDAETEKWVTALKEEGHRAVSLKSLGENSK